MATENKGIDAIVQAALDQVAAENIKAPWFDYAIRRLGGQLQVLHEAMEAGVLSPEQLQGLLAFKVDAVIAAAYAELGVDELEQARLQARVLKVLKKPLRNYFGFDVLF